MTTKNAKILLAHGGGGQLTDTFIREHILSRFDSDILACLGDSADIELESGSVCFTTDSYVVKPLFFNGGDIGKLAVCGTINDLAVAGAKPVALSLSLIIETGFDMVLLDRILDSVSKTARDNNVSIVTGDTKTVETGSADGIFINTAGIGVKLPGTALGMGMIKPGDKILINGTIGDHGLTIISQRKQFSFQTQLKSDCAALSSLTCKLLAETDGIRFMRDPTRGGLATTLNDIATGSGLDIEISEADLPVNPTVQAAADVLGFDILNIANEGKFIAVVSADSADDCLKICRKDRLGEKAVLIGQVKPAEAAPAVELKTKIGGRRIVQKPYGRELPRIC